MTVKALPNSKKISNRIPRDRTEKIMSVIAYIVMTFLALIAIFPCLHVISKSVSTGTAVTAGRVLFWPVGVQLDTIKYVFTKTDFFSALKNSLIVTVAGTAISMFTTITTAYPLSKQGFKGHRFITLLYVISMVFYGGIVPCYMVVVTMGILDTYWACILPFAIVQFNMFIVKNYFEGLPSEVEESAAIDGANDVRTLISIVLPMSVPVLATVALLYAINYWNNYFHVMMYTTSSSMRTMQLYLYDIINNSQAFAENLSNGAKGVGNYLENITTEGMVAAAVSLSIIPIIAAYPFIQRYMVHGITVGSVKG